MGEHDPVLQDAIDVRRAHPARSLIVPAQAIALGVGDRLVYELIRRAMGADGATGYVAAKGKAFRVTVEVVR